MVSVHADSFGFICLGFEISVSENNAFGGEWNFVCGTETIAKNIYKVQQDRVFPETLSLLLCIIPRPHCEPLFHKDYFFGRK